MVRPGKAAAMQYLATIKKSAHFRIEDFDERAAIEVALMTKDAIDKGDKKDGSKETWAKVKFDRQIVAIAKVNRVTVIYTDDNNLRKLAASQGVRAIGVGELPIPDAASQADWVKELDDQATSK